VPASHSKAAAQRRFREIFDEHARYVVRALRHLGVAEADLDDMAQEVFITVQRKLPEFEGRSKLSTWIYSICLRVASDYRRRAYVVRERAHAEPAEHVTGECVEDPALRVESRRLVQHLLGVLDADKRAVFVLYEIEGLTMREVAEVVECPLQTAYSRLHAARELLESEWRRLEGTQKP
jgi:RNA polymerase sigma-70 factor (ECF subfamily)